MAIGRKDRLRLLLVEIEREMRSVDLWQGHPPSAEALASPEPFCVDTMPLNQWLQWLLIPRLREMLNAGLPLPSSCNIYPIAEESFKPLSQDYGKLLALIKTFDETLTQPH